MVLEREVGQPQRLAGPDPGAHLGHVGVDVVAPERLGDRHAVVAVADEVQVADPVDGDRRERLAAALGGGDPLPAAAHARGGGAEAAVEVARAVDGADDRVERDRLQPELRLADHPERVDDLVERQDQPDVVGLPPQPPAEARPASASAGRGRSRPARPRRGSRCRRPPAEGYAASVVLARARPRRTSDDREDRVEAR